jgi:hypothetical protein
MKMQKKGLKLLPGKKKKKKKQSTSVQQPWSSEKLFKSLLPSLKDGGLTPVREREREKEKLPLHNEKYSEYFLVRLRASNKQTT